MKGRFLSPGRTIPCTPHLFERFYKGKNSKGSGFGIGLALAKAIFFRENAKVKAENQKHGGGMFTVRFYKGNL